MSRAAVTSDPLLDLGQFGFLLGRAFYTYIVFLEGWIEAEGLARWCKPGMGSFLSALLRQDDRTLTEIARELGVAKSTMTGVVARMRKSGLITTATCRDDSRAVRIKLTPLARSLEPKFRRIALGVESLLTQGISLADQQRFRQFFQQMIQVMNADVQARRSRRATATRRKPRVKVSRKT